MHEWGDSKGMGNMHRGIGVREEDIARSELFSGWIGSAEGGRGSGAQVRVGIGRVELLTRGEGRVQEGYVLAEVGWRGKGAGKAPSSSRCHGGVEGSTGARVAHGGREGDASWRSAREVKGVWSGMLGDGNSVTSLLRGHLGARERGFESAGGEVG